MRWRPRSWVSPPLELHFDGARLLIRFASNGAFADWRSGRGLAFPAKSFDRYFRAVWIERDFDCGARFHDAESRFFCPDQSVLWTVCTSCDLLFHRDRV